MISLFLIFFNLTPSFSGSDEDQAFKAFSETAIETMITDFAKKKLNEYVAEKMGETVVDQLVVQAFGETAQTGAVNQAFAAYNLYKSIQSYDDAETQSAKFYAAGAAAAAVATFINPAIGSLISIGLIAGQVGGAAITKKDQENLMATYEEIMRMQEEMVVHITKSIKSDSIYLLNLLNSFQKFYLDAAYHQSQIVKICKDFKPGFDPKIFTCFDHSTKYIYALKNAVFFIRLVVNYKSAEIDLSVFLESQKSKLSVESYENQLNSLEEILKAKELEIPGHIQTLSKLLVEYFKFIQKPLPELSQMACVLDLQRFSNQIAKADLSVIQTRDIAQTNYYLTKRYHLIDQALAFAENCSQSFPNRAETWNHWKTYLVTTKEAAFEEFLGSIYR